MDRTAECVTPSQLERAPRRDDGWCLIDRPTRSVWAGALGREGSSEEAIAWTSGQEKELLDETRAAVETTGADLALQGGSRKVRVAADFAQSTTYLVTYFICACQTWCCEVRARSQDRGKMV